MSKTITCISPVNGEVYAEREVLGPQAAMDAVARAKAAQVAWAALPLAERVDRVLAGIARLGENDSTIVEELAWQMGRPIRYGGEFAGVKERAEYMASIASAALAPSIAESSNDFERRIERTPLGVVLVIAPWNYPYLTAINVLAPALIAGNAVLLKSASQTILTGERLAEAFHSGGVPQEVFQAVTLDHETTEALIKARSFGFVNFTGSVGGGQAIERAAAGTFTATGLELGGKDPAYVMEDADLGWAVDTLMDGALFNAGQCCCGIERIYVARKQFDSFVDAAIDWTRKLKLGNPFDPDTTLGPMAQDRFAQHVRRQTAEATASGATQLIDQSWFPEDDGGAYLMPQLLIGVDHSMGVMREESFGPVVGIMPVDSDDQALALMNDSDYGLTASLWTSDQTRAMALARGIETGTVYLNRADYLDPALCWTGQKMTGRGAALSELGFHAVTRPRSYHFRKSKT